MSGRLLFVVANASIDRQYTVERLTANAIHRPTSVVAVPGGKGLNAARAAATLGGRVLAVGIVGGRAGDWIFDRLAELGVDARFARTTTETRTCVSVLDEATGELTEVYERGERITAAEWDALEALVSAEVIRGDVAAIAMSGSLPPGAPTDGFGRIARVARSAGGGKPAVLADTYRAALESLLAARPEVAKLNASEATEASGIVVTDPASAAAAGRTIRDAGARSVIVTLGLGGAVVVDRDGAATHLVPPDVRGRYPVGSGDAFLGGFAIAYVDGVTLVEAATRGLAAGIANALVPGAGVLDRDEVDRILPAIRSAAI